MKTALLFGASGLVGGHLLNELIKENYYSKIKIFVRSEPKISDPKIEIIRTDFNNLQNHKEDIKGDDCFLCIGTTKQNSPDKNEYRRVEFEVPKQVAQIAKSNSVNSFFFVVPIQKKQSSPLISSLWFSKLLKSILIISTLVSLISGSERTNIFILL